MSHAATWTRITRNVSPTGEASKAVACDLLGMERKRLPEALAIEPARHAGHRHYVLTKQEHCNETA